MADEQIGGFMWICVFFRHSKQKVEALRGDFPPEKTSEPTLSKQKNKGPLDLGVSLTQVSLSLRSFLATNPLLLRFRSPKPSRGGCSANKCGQKQAHQFQINEPGVGGGGWECFFYLFQKHINI